MAALATPALAADQPTTTVATSPEAIGPHTHQLHGSVKTTVAAGASSFALTTERFGDVTVSFTATTPNGHAHPRGTAGSHELASLPALTADERMVVHGRTSADGKTFVARRVHVIPAADSDSQATSHFVGTITSASTTSLTVKLADGTSQSVNVSQDTRIRPHGKTEADLAVGTRVMLLSKDGTATSIVVLPA
jgi:hypothetical protein